MAPWPKLRCRDVSLKVQGRRKGKWSEEEHEERAAEIDARARQSLSLIAKLEVGDFSPVEAVVAADTLEWICRI